MPFKRKTVVLGSSAEGDYEKPIERAYQPSSPVEFAALIKSSAPKKPKIEEPPVIVTTATEPSTDCSVLVVNNSDRMAKEITHELSLAIPGCSIIYSPTLELAKLILKRRSIHLVVSSSVLPDGSVAKLREELTLLPTPPDVLVVGEMSMAQTLSESGYCFVRAKKIGEPKTPKKAVVSRGAMPFRHKSSSTNIQSLGADIRNDLNNPLQEIVAMAFVAKAGGELSPAAEQALHAIEKAAQNMSKIVNGLEEKIRDVVDTK